MFNSEKNLILQNAIRVALNMVPDSGLDNYDDIETYLLRCCNFLQSQEILGGHCIAEFVLNNQYLMDIIKESVTENTRLSLIDTLYENYERKEEIYENFYEITSFLQTKGEVMNDLCLRNILQSCMEYKNPQAMQAVTENLVEYVLDLPKNKDIR